jgi:hypothetical protein
VKHVVMYSGGIGSWAAAKRVSAQHGTENLTLLFCDTKVEDQDTYRFLREGAANVGGQLVEIADGRTIWEVFRDERYLGNTMADPCSKILKRKLADKWLDQNCDQARTTIYVGIDWTEEHRYQRLAERRKPWSYQAPLCQPPYLSKLDLHVWAAREGLKRQRLYDLGMPHANCGGGCIKAGVGHFAKLYKALPEVFAHWETEEEKLREQLGDVSILRDRTGGATNRLTLRALRERLEREETVDVWDIGGCGCFVDSDAGREARGE